MTAFDIRAIDDLKPRDRRYDVLVEDDFAVSVFPNGVRTWVYLYEHDGRIQRRTLGIYPDMGLEQAHQRLAAARTTRRDLEALERSDRAAVARVRDTAARARHASAVPATVLAVAAIAALVIYLATRLGAADREPTAGSTLSPPPPRDARASTDGPQTPRVNPPASAPAHQSASPATTSPAPAPAAALAVTPAAERATPARQHEAPAHDTEGNAPAARVTRALLTSDVVGHEPVDTLGPEIMGDHDGATHVCFYTELRGLSGKQVRYRWEREGHVESENTMLVGTSWRWRAYSRKEILPTQTGQWRVQLRDADDRLLAEASFLFRADQPDPHAAETD